MNPSKNHVWQSQELTDMRWQFLLVNSKDWVHWHVLNAGKFVDSQEKEQLSTWIDILSSEWTLSNVVLQHDCHERDISRCTCKGKETKWNVHAWYATIFFEWMVWVPSFMPRPSTVVHLWAGVHRNLKIVWTLFPALAQRPMGHLPHSDRRQTCSDHCMHVATINLSVDCRH